MNTKKFTTFCIVILFTNLCFAQKPQIIAGPMLGYVEHREVELWLEVSRNTPRVTIVFHPTNNPKLIRKIEKYPDFSNGFTTLKIVLDNLEPGLEYEYEVYLIEDKILMPFETKFATKKLWEWREPAPEFSLLFGSCVYINDSAYDRPGKPYGSSLKILNSMENIKSDFILWGGDNVYLREADYSSESGIKYRYRKNFATTEFQKLRASRANYALWDDHDYGNNDGDATFELANVSYDCFKNYWANKTFGEEGKGIYTKIKWADCEFLLLDARTFRSPNDLPDSIHGKPNVEKNFLGDKQMLWLKNNLVASKATFKFIVNGGQVLNPIADKECWQHYPKEYFELTNFIKDNAISGIVFLTGDRHFTEMQKVKNIAKYPLYDFTCSSITSGIYDISKKKEFISPTRVEGSLLMENNFSKISVTGAKNNRKIIFETFGVDGTKKWNFEVNENELK